RPPRALCGRPRRGRPRRDRRRAALAARRRLRPRGPLLVSGPDARADRRDRGGPQRAHARRLLRGLGPAPATLPAGLRRRQALDRAGRRDPAPSPRRDRARGRSAHSPAREFPLPERTLMRTRLLLAGLAVFALAGCGSSGSGNAITVG